MDDDSDSPLRRTLAALAMYSFGGRSLQDALAEVANLTLETVDGADFIALIVAVEQRPMTTYFTDPRAYDLDQVQYAANSGPCLDAYRNGEIYIIEATPTEPRWPAFAAAAVQRGVGSTLSLPLTVEQVHLGAMNLYSTRERSFGRHEVELGMQFAAPAAVLLANAAVYADAVALSQNLAQATQSRATIEQAKGIIMSSMGVDAEAAMALLTEQSQKQNVKLRDIAHKMVSNAARRANADIRVRG
jgi:GAF domain-containing protein